MEILFANVNLLAVLLATVAAMVVGFVWYSPMLFGNTWTAAMGMKKTDGMGKDAMNGYMATAVTSLIMAYVLAVVLALFGATNIADVAYVTFLLWLGFVLTTHVPSLFFEKKRQSLFLINVGHFLAAMLAMGVVLYLLP